MRRMFSRQLGLFPLWSSSRWCRPLEKSLERCFQCQDTLSLYRLALTMMLDSFNTDRERHITREVSGV